MLPLALNLFSLCSYCDENHHDLLVRRFILSAPRHEETRGLSRIVLAGGLG